MKNEFGAISHRSAQSRVAIGASPISEIGGEFFARGSRKPAAHLVTLGDGQKKAHSLSDQSGNVTTFEVFVC
jgi:hypothetical protein